MAEQKVTLVSALLRRAELWQQEGKIHQAKDIYFRLVEGSPETDEAKKAADKLLGLAEELEEKGQVYMAMSIRDKLATPLAPPTGLRILSPGGRPM